MPWSRANVSTSSMSRKERLGGGGLARSPVDGQSATRACSRRAWMFAPSSSRHEKSSLDDEEGAASETAIEAATRSGRRRPVGPRVSPRRTRVHGTGTWGRAHATVAMVARTRSEDCAAESHNNWIKKCRVEKRVKNVPIRPPPLQARIRRRTRQNGFSDERIRRQVGGSRGRGCLDRRYHGRSRLVRRPDPLEHQRDSRHR